MTDWITLVAIVGSTLLHFILEGRIKANPTAEDRVFDLKSARLWNLITLSCMALPLIEMAVLGPVTPWPRWAMVGLPLMVLGMGLRYQAILKLGTYFTYPICLRPEHRLVQDGLYRRWRHPSYFANFLILTGAWAMLQSRWLPFGILAYAAMTWYRIRREEKVLLEHFGPEYARYQESSKALIPFVL